MQFALNDGVRELGLWEPVPLGTPEGAAIDERTEGKYAVKVARAKQQVSKGVDKLAEQRPSQGEMPPTPTDPPI